jgi:signal transduction histidine kinase
MFTSLRSRLWLSYALLVTVALWVVAGVFVVYLIRNPISYRQAAQKLSAVQEIMLATQEDWAGLPPDKLQKELERREKGLQVRLLVLMPNRSILADSSAGLGPPLEVNRVTRLTRQLFDVNGEAWLATVQKLDNGSFLVVAAPRPKLLPLAVFRDELLPPLLYGGLVALALALLLAFWMARWVADPLQGLVNAAAQFPEAGARPQRLAGPQEVRELVNAFNQMTARVQAGQKSQKEFVANVSHELKTPLTSIQGFAQAILDGTAGTPETQSHAAQIIFDEAGRMHRMVLDLLDLARLDAGMLELNLAPLDVRALLNNIAEKFSLQAQRAGIRLEVNCPALPAIPADGDRLAQVLTNLVDNALKFTPSGGLIALEGAALPTGLEIRVGDTGPGIPPQALPRIFERFYQADLARQGGKKHGAGLGLAIAAEITRAHGGKISVRSEMGQGSQFTVWLPFANPDASTIASRRKKPWA